MCAYNRVNGTYACEDSKMLNKLLKEDLGFEGYVCSDFFAAMPGVKSAKANLDLDLPGPISPTDLKDSQNLLHVVQNGTLSSERLDEMVRRVLVSYHYHGQASNYPSLDPSTHNPVLQYLGALPDGTPIPPRRDIRANHNVVIRI